MAETPAQRRARAAGGTSAQPRNRPLRGFGERTCRGSGRGRGDWRHSMMDNQMGCLVSLAASLPVVWFFGKLIGFW